MATTSTTKRVMRAGLWTAVFAALGCLTVGGYEVVDEFGFLSHRETTVISAKSDWLVGESKECTGGTLNSDGAARLNEEIGYALAFVSCDDGPDHKMQVTFYGRKVQPEYDAVSWRCVRNETSFTCYQSGGDRPR